MRIGHQDHAVDEQLGEFKGAHFGTAVPWVANVVATNGDAGSVRVFFLRVHFSDNVGEGDIVVMIGGDFMEVDGAESVRSGNTWLGEIR